MPSTVENKEGAINSYYDADSGKVSETGSPNLHDFYRPGAQVELPAGTAVTYIKVTTPTGKIIINDIQSK